MTIILFIGIDFESQPIHKLYCVESDIAPHCTIIIIVAHAQKYLKQKCPG